MIVDPFVDKAVTIEAALRTLGFDVVASSTIAEGMAAFDLLRPAYVLTELRFTDGSGFDFLRYALSAHPTARVVVHTWFADLQVAVAATKAGAYDFVPKPTDAEFLANILLLGAANVPEECRILDPNQLRRQHIEHVMHVSRTNVSLAARTLLLDRRSLQRLVRRHAPNQRSAASVCEARPDGQNALVAKHVVIPRPLIPLTKLAPTLDDGPETFQWHSPDS